MSCVLDASATLAWILPGESTPAIQAVFDRIADSEARVPHLWRIEVANGLSMGIKRKRISRDERDKAFQDFLALPIFDDTEGQARVWHQTVHLSDRYNLTVYDAAYLELAIRLSLPLETLDRDLRLAAHTEGVQLLGM